MFYVDGASEIVSKFEFNTIDGYNWFDSFLFIFLSLNFLFECNSRCLCKFDTFENSLLNK